MMLLEIIVALGVIWLIWSVENKDPTQHIIPATDEEVELVG